MGKWFDPSFSYFLSPSLPLCALSAQQTVKVSSVRLENADQYLEQLYEDDAEQKLMGTTAILQLVQTPKNLEYFLNNPSYIGALTRMLSEERKKDADLVSESVDCCR